MAKPSTRAMEYRANSWLLTVIFAWVSLHFTFSAQINSWEISMKACGFVSS